MSWWMRRYLDGGFCWFRHAGYFGERELRVGRVGLTLPCLVVIRTFQIPWWKFESFHAPSHWTWCFMGFALTIYRAVTTA
jgi:hypothetical protein